MSLEQARFVAVSFRVTTNIIVSVIDYPPITEMEFLKHKKCLVEGTTWEY